MVLALDIDVLADDFFVRFIVDFEHDDIQKSFLQKQPGTQWFATSDVANTRIDNHDVDECILAIQEAIHKLGNKTTSEIYGLAHTTHHPFFTMTTVPLHD